MVKKAAFVDDNVFIFGLILRIQGWAHIVTFISPCKGTWLWYLSICL